MKELVLIIALVILIVMQDVSWDKSSLSHFIHIFNSSPLTLTSQVFTTHVLA
jgi:hypothetical protein